MPPLRSQHTPGFLAALQRERAKSNGRGVNMIPHTLRSWEASVERAVGNGSRSLATARPQSAAASPAASRAVAAGAASPHSRRKQSQTPTQYELRQFLQHSERYFLSVPVKDFGTPSHAIDGQPMTVRAGLA